MSWGRGTCLLRYLTRLRHQVAAGHQLDHPPCDHPHGHGYTVTLVIEGVSDPKWDLAPVDPDALARARAVISEYDRRPLGPMLGNGTIPSVYGFANVLMERLVMVVPGLVSLEVEEYGGPIAIVERTAQR